MLATFLHSIHSSQWVQYFTGSTVYGVSMTACPSVIQPLYSEYPKRQVEISIAENYISLYLGWQMQMINIKIAT